MTYQGYVEESSTVSAGIVQARLYGFLVDDAQLGELHKNWLDDYVIPIVSAGGSASLSGEASRTGTAMHNLRLSRRRARETQRYIGQYARGPVRCTDLTGIRHGTSASGAGEQSAAAIGQGDNVEDDLFRAVIVRASLGAVPTPTQPTPHSMTTRRVISRVWRNNISSTPRTGSPYASGEAGVLVAEQLRRAIDVAQRGGTDRRQYAMFPKTWAVVRVTENFTVDSSDTSLTGNTVRTTREILYEWGSRTPTVTLFKRTTEIDEHGQSNVTLGTDTYLRNQIWRHVSAPGATVY